MLLVLVSLLRFAYHCFASARDSWPGASRTQPTRCFNGDTGGVNVGAAKTQIQIIAIVSSVKARDRHTLCLEMYACCSDRIHSAHVAGQLSMARDQAGPRPLALHRANVREASLIALLPLPQGYRTMYVPHPQMYLSFIHVGEHDFRNNALGFPQ